MSSMAMASSTLGMCSTSKNFVSVKSIHSIASSGSEFVPASSVWSCKVGKVNGLRSATLEFVSCSSRFSAEGVIQNGSRGRVGVIVKAQQGYSEEDARWAREEQRWLREEQRWQREEARWSAMNIALQEEVAVLKMEIEQLRAQMGQGGQITDTSLKSLVSGMRTLLQALAAPAAEEVSYLVEKSEVELTPMTLVATPEEVSTVIIPEMNTSTQAAPVPRAPAPAEKRANVTQPVTKTKRTLKTGMDGDDVKALQDALAELGFNSGEEDVEFAMFSSDTSRAVKAWQATVGVDDNGQVTPELMTALLAEVAANASQKSDAQVPATKFQQQDERQVTNLNLKSAAEVETPQKKQPAAARGTREIDKFERSDAEETASGSSRRVYLLGENRWEEPERLRKKQTEDKGNKNGASAGMKVSSQKCFSCRGQGTILCTECEGTGDLNVEEQFLDWVEEDAKCIYCNGSGAVQCDVCLGTG